MPQDASITVNDTGIRLLNRVGQDGKVRMLTRMCDHKMLFSELERHQDISGKFVSINLHHLHLRGHLKSSEDPKYDRRSSTVIALYLGW